MRIGTKALHSNRLVNRELIVINHQFFITKIIILINSLRAKGNFGVLQKLVSFLTQV